MVSVEIIEHNCMTIWFRTRFFGESDTERLHVAGIFPEIAGVEEYGHAASSLVTDVWHLFWSGCLREQQRSPG